MTRYIYFVIDFEVNTKSNLSKIIHHINDNIFNNEVIQAEAGPRPDGSRKSESMFSFRFTTQC